MESAGLVVDVLGRFRDMVRNALKDLSPLVFDQASRRTDYYFVFSWRTRVNAGV
jgi:hypothetical protein